jgi:hypothetical protein
MSEKKKFSFKESKVGKFLNTHGKTALGTVLDIADDIYPPLGLITKAADMAGLTPDKKQELEAIYNDESKEFIEMMYADKDSARKMQQTALNQDDVFSKRFVYYFAAFWGLVAAVFIFVIMFYPIPEQNKRLIDTVLGFLMGTIVSTIISFFYGSSKGSMDKNNLINK